MCTLLQQVSQKTDPIWVGMFIGRKYHMCKKEFATNTAEQTLPPAWSMEVDGS